ncbi:MAG: hypothetical protein HYZ54_09275 [Ignavibacteriae bacterium]|nr:hypothetical protein [Ignavibacteriota bacterium]
MRQIIGIFICIGFLPSGSIYSASRHSSCKISHHQVGQEIDSFAYSQNDMQTEQGSIIINDNDKDN